MRAPKSNRVLEFYNSTHTHKYTDVIYLTTTGVRQEILFRKFWFGVCMYAHLLKYVVVCVLCWSNCVYSMFVCVSSYA